MGWALGGGAGPGGAAQDPELVVVTEPGNLVPVVTDQPHGRAALHALPQDLERHLRGVLRAAFHRARCLANSVSVGTEVVQSVKVATIDAPSRAADVQPW